MNDFSKAKIGQRVYSVLSGYGVITKLDFDNEPYVIFVDFDEYGDNFTVNGFSLVSHKHPTLYWDKPEIIAPPEPIQTKLINGVEVPDISFQPDLNESYHFPAPCYEYLYGHTEYEDYETDRHCANYNLCYPMTNEGKEAAILHAKAMLGIAD